MSAIVENYKVLILGNVYQSSVIRMGIVAKAFDTHVMIVIVQF